MIENTLIDELTIRCLGYNIFRSKPSSEAEAFELAIRYCRVLGLNEQTQPAIIYDYWRKLRVRESRIDALDDATGQGRR